MQKIQDTYKFWPSLTIDELLLPEVLDPSFTDILKKLAFDLGAAADKYTSLSREEFKLTYEGRLEPIKIEGHAWKTALKVMSYFLTLGILPIVALVAKVLYKNWCETEFERFHAGAKVNLEPQIQQQEPEPQIQKQEIKPEYFPKDLGLPPETEYFFPNWDNRIYMKDWPLGDYDPSDMSNEAQLSRVTCPFYKYHEGKTSIGFKMGNIVHDNSAVLVNAANAQLVSGAGVCGSFFDHAGQGIFDECVQIKKSLGNLYAIPIGETVLTSAGNLKQFESVKAVLHTVSPKGSDAHKEKLMEDAILNSLKLAAGLEENKAYISDKKLPKEDKYRSIAFPALGTGIYRYPKPLAAEIAAKTVKKFVQDHPDAFDEINFIFSDDTVYYYLDAFNKIFK